MFVYNTEWGFLEFKVKEVVEFFDKFSYGSLEYFDKILYFANFDGNNEEFVTKILLIKEMVQESKKSVNPKNMITQEIRLLSEKELELMTNLLDEAVFCAECDERYPYEARCLDYLKTKCEFELEKVTHSKAKATPGKSKTTHVKRKALKRKKH